MAYDLLEPETKSGGYDILEPEQPSMEDAIKLANTPTGQDSSGIISSLLSKQVQPVPDVTDAAMQARTTPEKWNELQNVPHSAFGVMGTALAEAANVPARIYRAIEGTPKIGVVNRDVNGKETLTSEDKPLPFAFNKPLVSFQRKEANPEGNTLKGIIEGLTTPEMIASFPMAATKPAQIAFLTQTAPAAVDAATQLISPQADPQKRREAATELLLNGLMTYGLGKSLKGESPPINNVGNAIGSQLDQFRPKGAVPLPEETAPIDMEMKVGELRTANLPMTPKMEEQLKGAEINLSSGMKEKVLGNKIKSPLAFQRVFPNLNLSLEEAQSVLNNVWNKNDNVPEKYLNQENKTPVIAPQEEIPLTNKGGAQEDLPPEQKAISEQNNSPENAGWNDLKSTAKKTASPEQATGVSTSAIPPKEVITTPKPVEPVNEIPEGEAISTRGEDVLRAAVEKKLMDVEQEVPTHEKMNVKSEVAKAVEFIKSNPEDALKIAVGEQNQSGVRAEAVYTTLEEKAIREGDVETLKTLSESSLPTEAGQRLKLLDSNDPNSPVKIMRDIRQAREFAGEIHTRTTKDKIVNEIKTNMRRASSKSQSWEDVVNQLICRN